ncbi:MAG TPA: hypothetical protein VMT63_02630 [Bacteroidales bacterium]|nr:hypothetical protein [Bacteroidales bacterium]
MRLRLLILFITSLSGVLVAQDTIYVKRGKPIIAYIISKDNTEIVYKKKDQPDSSGLYTVFVADIRSIHYKNHIVADYTRIDYDENAEIHKAEEKTSRKNSIVFSLESGIELLTRNNDDDVLKLWKSNTKSGTGLEGNRFALPVYFKFTMFFGQSKRNSLTNGLGITYLPKYVYGSENNGENMIRLNNYILSDIVDFSHSLNLKKTVFIVIATGIDIYFLSGNLKLGSIAYSNILDEAVPVSPRLAAGLDLVISDRFTFNIRLGCNISKNDFLSYYTVSNRTDGDIGRINLKGPYILLNMTWNFWYFKNRLKFKPGKDQI